MPSILQLVSSTDAFGVFDAYMEVLLILSWLLQVYFQSGANWSRVRHREACKRQKDCRAAGEEVEVAV